MSTIKRKFDRSNIHSIRRLGDLQSHCHQSTCEKGCWHPAWGVDELRLETEATLSSPWARGVRLVGLAIFAWCGASKGVRFVSSVAGLTIELVG